MSEWPARRVALVKPSALGDIVHSLPVLAALRQRYPDARITWVVNRTYEPLLRGHPDLTDTLPFDRSASRRGWLTGLRSHADFLRELRRRRFDLVVDLQGLLRTGLMTLASGARRRVGLATAREGSRGCYTDVVPVPDPDRVHAVDRYWRVAEAFGVAGQPTFRVPIDPHAAEWAGQTLVSFPRPWIALGVGSRWLTKRWPPSHFAALARQAQATWGGTAVFVGGADEADLARQTLAEIHGPTLDLTGRTTLPQLAAVLARTDAMVANDTGPLHLAAALGRPVVAPYTCTRVTLTGPYRPIAGGAVETRVWCQGSCLKRCPRMECMAELTPDRLWPLLAGVLQAWESRSRSA